MSLLVAVPIGVAAAAVYGTAIVGQHRTAQHHARSAATSAAGLWRLARDPLWLTATGGDLVGFLLQAAALSLGSVVVIQPLTVLMLPVALAVGALIGDHRPRRGDYLGCLAVLGGLALFLALIGQPVAAQVPAPRTLAVVTMTAVVGGVLLCVLMLRSRGVARGVVYGAVAGGWFGVMAMMIDAASAEAGREGVSSLVTQARGIVPLAGVVVLGLAGTVLTQMSFQVGTLGATLPASLAADPLVAVAVGAALLHEHIPLSAGHLASYAACLVAVTAGAVRLAEPQTRPVSTGSAPATRRS